MSLLMAISIMFSSAAAILIIVYKEPKERQFDRDPNQIWVYAQTKKFAGYVYHERSDHLIAPWLVTILELFLFGIWMNVQGYGWFFGSVSALIGSIIGYRVYQVVYYNNHKRSAKVTQTIFVILSLGIMLHALFHKSSLILAEGIIPLVLIVLVFSMEPLGKILGFLQQLPKERAARKQLYASLDYDMELIKRAEAMRRQYGGKPMSYRDLLDMLTRMSNK